MHISHTGQRSKSTKSAAYGRALLDLLFTILEQKASVVGRHSFTGSIGCQGDRREDGCSAKGVNIHEPCTENAQVFHSHRREAGDLPHSCKSNSIRHIKLKFLELRERYRASIKSAYRTVPVHPEYRPLLGTG